MSRAFGVQNAGETVSASKTKRVVVKSLGFWRRGRRGGRCRDALVSREENERDVEEETGPKVETRKTRDDRVVFETTLVFYYIGDDDVLFFPLGTGRRRRGQQRARTW
jgi:hypothetical protein|tara:strand:- start:170 stop:493 length:324 start_codon:yes stop_codon:yes gene_type:complete